MDYKEKVIDLLNRKELSKEQKEKLENIFPELKENEDERIRKEIIEIIKKEATLFPSSIIASKADLWVAWLKRSEQKPIGAKVIIPKFRIGDEIKTLNEESMIITDIDDIGYWSNELFICDFEDSVAWDLVEKKPEWSKEDEEMFATISDLLWIGYKVSGGKPTWEEIRDWFRTNYSQKKWKPSEIQMSALKVASGLANSDMQAHLYSLYNDLKNYE